MELQDQVCTFTQSQILKRLGVNQHSSYFIYRHWRGNGQIIVDKRKDKYFDYAKSRHVAPFTEILCSAFTVAELGMMLPSETLTIRRGSENSKFPNWEWENEGQQEGCGCFDTEASARADHLIMLLENNLIKVEVINERLK
jgi:hypothetical protein